MSRTGNDYTEDEMRKAVIEAVRTGTAGDPTTYQYVQASRNVKILYNLDIPETNIRRWVREHPDWVSVVKIILDEQVHKDLAKAIGLAGSLLVIGLTRLKDKLDGKGDISSTDLRNLSTVFGTLIDKKKITDAGIDAANDIPGQTKIVFDKDSATEFAPKHYDREGNEIPQAEGQTGLEDMLPSGEK